ncbi:hypothetical protein OPS25_12890 [Alteromonas ponticola]|uniref:Secreted protein n=1 Tax=Alteromonas aquimaris TaxID=2998417 RepID=A0ABT3P9L0_9ALTE|nr:hypothetical protein [Alteromonas aquimaris]MCW8109399.1 hypothetical protein [Alteromonas aquimaris]
MCANAFLSNALRKSMLHASLYSLLAVHLANDPADISLWRGQTQHEHYTNHKGQYAPINGRKFTFYLPADQTRIESGKFHRNWLFFINSGFTFAADMIRISHHF